MSKTYFLPNVNKPLTQTAMVNYFKGMREKYPNSGDVVTQEKDLEDLRYYLKFHYTDDKNIKGKIDLNNAEFFVAPPPNPRNSHNCFWVRNKISGLALHFSTSEKGFIAPSSKKNFDDCLISMLIPYKREIRELIAKQKGFLIDSVDLWHKEPKTEQIISEFIELKQIGDKLDEIISPNGLGNNIPFLQKGYEHLGNEFLAFYFEKVSKNEIKYDTKWLKMR